MTSNALKWARNLGLNCELDIMAETLRTLIRIQIGTTVSAIALVVIVLLLLFSPTPAKAWSPERPTVALASLTDESPGVPSRVRKALPTCAEFVEMDTELRQTGISAVLTRLLGVAEIEGDAVTCMLDHVYKIDMALHNICVADPMVWEVAFLRATALYAPHCGLEVSP